MDEKPDPLDFITEGFSNRKQCYICGETMPKDLKRIVVRYQSKYGSSDHQICAYCLTMIGMKIKPKGFEQWLKQRITEKI